MKANIHLSQANTGDAEYLCNLINVAYRGDEGWTKETEIVSGKRVSVEGIKSLLVINNAHLLKATISNQLVACVCVEQKESQAYIGTFAVTPSFQNKGVGKRVLELAEEYAIKELGANELMMAVISQRDELMAFYERRGYKRTGNTKEYPAHLDFGVPKIEGLTVEYLSKNA